MNLALQAVPEGIDLADVKVYLAELPQVTAVHNLHIWPMSTTETALTVHLELHEAHPGDAFLHEVCERLHQKFAIHHSTIQIERDARACALAPDQVV